MENILTSSMDSTLAKEYEDLCISRRLNLRYWDNPVLSKPALEIEETEFGNSLSEFGDLMIQTMILNKGLGLAGPQVGLSKRIFVMNQYPEGKEITPLVICNPVLSLSGVTDFGMEGCLSMPGVFESVQRSTSLTVNYFTPYGEQKKLALYDLAARVVQHETDHLDGKMFFSGLGRQVRKRVLSIWSQERRRRGI